MALHLNLQLQENRAEAAEQRRADEARHMQEIAAITRQFEQQAEELRAELSASRIEEETSTDGLEVEAQQGKEDEQEMFLTKSLGDFHGEGGGGCDSDGDIDAGNFDSPDDLNTSRRSLV